MSTEMQFYREDIDKYLNLLAREYRKRNRKAKHVELILVGGASVIINYGFRDMTTDIDAIILADSIMKEAIFAVAEKEGLPDGWLNADFKRSASFSEKLIQHSDYYRTFSNVLEVRTVRSEYLLAMKLVAGRNYKRDLSDIVGIMIAAEENGHIISREQVDSAMKELYGDWSLVDEYTVQVFEDVLALNITERHALYDSIQEEEDKNKSVRMEELKKKNEK